MRAEERAGLVRGEEGVKGAGLQMVVRLPMGEMQSQADQETVEPLSFRCKVSIHGRGGLNTWPACAIDPLQIHRKVKKRFKSPNCT